jgi:hypothetical protein
MNEKRPAIPTEIRREVLIETGHRCAIHTCTNTSNLDLHHIKPWSKCKEHQADNLIVLCPNCHRLAHDGTIDQKSLLEYKKNCQKAISSNNIKEFKIFNIDEFDFMNLSFEISGTIEDGRSILKIWNEKLTLDEIFFIISEDLLNTQSEYFIKDKLGEELQSVSHMGLDAIISKNCFRAIARVLSEHGLINIEKLKNKGGKMSLFWSLTEKGEWFMLNAKRY